MQFPARSSPAVRRLRHVLLPLLFVQLMCSGALCSEAAPQASLEKQAEKTYAAYCADCHGARLEGAQAPPLIAPRWMQADAEQQLSKRIHEGVPARGMPAWAGVLAEADIQSLAGHIHELNVRQAEHGDPFDKSRNDAPSILKTNLYDIRVESIEIGRASCRERVSKQV